MIYPIVMAGGSGTRLWPMSREKYPKQFLSLNGKQTLLQETLHRLEGLDVSSPVVICNEEHRFLAAEQLRQSGLLDHNIILEPFGRNTAPAVALASFSILRDDPDAMLLVLSADHSMSKPENFRASVRAAVPLAEEGKLVTFGIVPSRPETGYGYVKRGKADGQGYKVDQFVEKPDEPTAINYLKNGDYYWNSGMFLMRADSYLKELDRYRPDIHQACVNSMADLQDDLDFIRIRQSDFESCPSESIDYAVMEKTNKSVMVTLDAGWSDVGSWSALWELGEKSLDGNVCHGDVITHDTRNTYIFSEDNLVTTLGIEDIVIVQTKDAIMVAHRDHVQDVKVIVEKLKSMGRSEYALHREVYRPWGKYDSVDNGQRYQVKRITVKPGEKLSVQKHHHRSEHWVVVSGTANVTIDGVTTMLSENQSIYIPLGSVHALENPGKIPLELIEVQSGAYLGEDDIVRFEDRYGRH